VEYAATFVPVSSAPQMSKNISGSLQPAEHSGLHGSPGSGYVQTVVVVEVWVVSTTAKGVGIGVGKGVGPGVGNGVGIGVGTGVGLGVSIGVGIGVGTGVGFGVGTGVGMGVGTCVLVVVVKVLVVTTQPAQYLGHLGTTKKLHGSSQNVREMLGHHGWSTAVSSSQSNGVVGAVVAVVVVMVRVVIVDVIVVTVDVLVVMVVVDGCDEIVVRLVPSPTPGWHKNLCKASSKNSLERSSAWLSTIKLCSGDDAMSSNFGSIKNSATNLLAFGGKTLIVKKVVSTAFISSATSLATEK